MFNRLQSKFKQTNDITKNYILILASMAFMLPALALLHLMCNLVSK